MGEKKRPVSRRDMLRWLVIAGGGAALAACNGGGTVEKAKSPANATANTASNPLPTQRSIPEPTSAPTNGQPQPEPTGASAGEQPAGAKQAPAASSEPPYMVVARGADPAAITEAAIKVLGGIERFLKPGGDVIIKPNICTDYYTYEYGATTNPVVVATLVKLALGAGAKRVRVMDLPFGGTAESAYVKSGIAEAVKAAGGEMESMNPNKYKMTKIPNGKAMKEWKIYQDVLTCDLLIDVGIAKHHSLARMTASMKNLLGVVQNRSAVHSILTQGLGDLLSAIKPGLSVVDAVRTLMRNGPTGGSLDDVKMNNTVIASPDMVATDAYSCGFFGLTGKDIGYIRAAAERGLGTIDLESVKVEEISL